MSSVALGVLAVVVGAVLCFRGVAAMRVVIAVWGGFVGLVIGGTIVAEATGSEYLDTPAGWLLGCLLAVVFALLAYLYYAVAVVLAMGAVGFALGAGAVTAIGVDADWVAVVAGAVVAAGLAALAVAVDLPALVLLAVSVLGGALLTVFGIMAVTGQADLEQLRAEGANELLTGWWYVLYAALLVTGAVVQFRGLISGCSMRTQWDRTKTG